MSYKTIGVKMICIKNEQNKVCFTNNLIKCATKTSYSAFIDLFLCKLL